MEIEIVTEAHTLGETVEANTTESDTIPADITGISLGEQIFIAIRFVWGFLSVFGNSLTVLSVVKFDYLQSSANYIISNLALADMFNGISSMIFLIPLAYTNGSSPWKPLCLTFNTFILFSNFGNCMSSCMISIDRFIYIHTPLRYYDIVTEKKTKLALGISWLYTVVMTSLAFGLGTQLEDGMPCDMRVFVHPLVFTITVTANVILLSLTTIILYIYIGYTAIKQSKQIHDVNTDADQKKSAKAQMKITKMLGMVIGIYLGTYLAVFLVDPLLDIGGEEEATWKDVIRMLSLLVFYTTTWLNPLIYAWKAKDFRKAFKELLHLG